MTLQEYYDGLPEKTAPKSDLVRDLANHCNITEAQVRNWVKGRSNPANPEHVEYICKRTGLDASELFPKMTVQSK